MNLSVRETECESGAPILTVFDELNPVATICTTLDRGQVPDDQEWQYGKLFAAAPELLAAAKRLLLDAQDRGETEDEETDQEYDDWRQLREAVEKAEGSAVA